MAKLPKSISKYFWGDDLNSLSIDKNKRYITHTILDRGDLPALRWLFKRISKSDAKKLSLPKCAKNLSIFSDSIFS